MQKPASVIQKNMKILIICKDIGGYAKKLCQHLGKSNEICFIDTSKPVYSLRWIPKTLRTPLRKWLDLRAFKSRMLKLSRFDVVLIINPAQINSKLIDFALSIASRKLAYLYDSFSRWPMTPESLAGYDKVFSFDQKNVDSHGLVKLHNYIYDAPEIIKTPNLYTASVVMAGKDRVPVLTALAISFDKLGISDYKFLVQCKPPNDAHPGITFFRERMSLEVVGELVKQSSIIIDISKPGQSGLSFRFFEAMPYRKKVITTNRSVAEYDFYNPKNILIIEEDNPVIPISFLVEPYVEIPPAIYHKYTLDGWVETVFDS